MSVAPGRSSPASTVRRAPQLGPLPRPVAPRGAGDRPGRSAVATPWTLGRRHAPGRPPHTRASADYTRAVNDERYEQGMPILDRQAVRAPVVPPSMAGLPPRSVPETKPTPLQRHYVLLSAPALVLGAVAITALELGVPLGSPLIKLCVLVAAPLLAVANADAIVRIWRSAWAWMPVDRTKGLFRLAWVVVAVILYALLLGAAWLVLTA
jgi:hypothetical protein